MAASAAAQISSSLCCYSSACETSAKTASSARLPRKFGTAFATGSSLFPVRCEKSSKQSNAVDVWLGRLAMVGFASGISVEIATGKGLLENFGVATPLPTVALAVTLLVGVLTAVFCLHLPICIGELISFARILLFYASKNSLFF